ncbi:helicase [Bifidobacterium sp. DSM 109958]|uniref:Helicase n=1 Tax=Bifidobacterium moraviense TaxID=2675323 RepID=A0A7Y0HYG2_9BIFI|nr:hypothetical protein [Bifidobacterium sp. DSM 109958]NMM99738.1 helicase [Bifidobacterium sp. DSM 109958]
MAEEANNTDQLQDAGEPHGEQSTGWESKYREAVSHSHEWETRAKDNKAVADELQQLTESQMSEQQKAEAWLRCDAQSTMMFSGQLPRAHSMPIVTILPA